jgi:hypothetical protein
MADGLEWLPDEGVALTKADLERIFVALRALISGTAQLEPNRAHAVDIAVTIPGRRAQLWRRLMAKPKAIQWLEKETGQSIPYVPDELAAEGRERHLSVRVDRTMAVALDAMAAERGVTVSQLVRELLAQAVNERQRTAGMDAQALVDRLAADVAEVRRRLAG